MLVERHSRELFRLAYRLTGRQENAEDVVQETFLKAYRALHRFDSRSRFSTWLYRIATNTAMDLLRRAQRDERDARKHEHGSPAADVEAVGHRRASLFALPARPT